jgi:hypothetical protein
MTHPSPARIRLYYPFPDILLCLAFITTMPTAAATASPQGIFPEPELPSPTMNGLNRTIPARRPSICRPSA